MTGKVYRSAQGKMVDLGSLQLQNEEVRAVGNMGVNARGDRINSQNKAIDSRNQQVERQYQKQVSNVRNDKVEVSSRRAHEAAKADEFASPQPDEQQQDTPTSGLAAAIARAQNKGE